MSTKNIEKKYDIFIPVAPKDYNKLKFLVRSIEENLIGWNHIYVTTPTGEKLLDHPKISYFYDREILNIEPTRFKFRPGWLYQMYLKMFQNVTGDLFATFDSDLIINRPLEMVTTEGKLVWWTGWEQNHIPYFNFQERVLNLPREYPSTFINDMNFMSKSIIQEMLQRNGFTLESFIEKSFQIITHECYPAEPEIYGQYVMKYHADMYDVRPAKTLSNPRSQNHLVNFEAQVWSDEEIQTEIDKVKSKDVDMFMLHSWLDYNVYNWK